MNNQTKSTYNQVNKLLLCTNLDDARDALDIFLDYFFEIIQNQTEGKYGNQIKPHAKIMHQMVFMKTLHLKQILGGEPYKDLPHLIDPGVIAIICRNILETVGVFHLIYVKPKSDEEKELLYYLWVYAGLRNRQEYEESFTITDQSEKFESEKATMNKIVKIINQNRFYKSLNGDNKTKINNCLKNGKYLVSIENNKTRVLKWHELPKVIGLKDGIFDKIYSYYSMYAHPSNVSVFQFDKMYTPEEQGYIQMTLFNLKNIFCLLSFFSKDFIDVFPEVEDSFNKLSADEKLLLTSYNSIAREHGDAH